MKGAFNKEETRIYVSIAWDTESGGVRMDPEELGLPTELELHLPIPEKLAVSVVESIDGDMLVEKLSDAYGYCIEGLSISVSVEKSE